MKTEIDLPDYEILHPEIQRGLVEMAKGACAVLVTAKRGKYPDDPALEQDFYEHMRHAKNHATDEWNEVGLDDDGHPHMHHCTARVALAISRMNRVR